MRFIPIFAAAFVLLVPELGIAQSPKPRPLAAGGTTPQIGIADGILNGRLLFRWGVSTSVVKQIPVTKTKSLVENGSTKVIAYSEYQSVVEWIPVTAESIPLEQVQAFDAEGLPISRERIESMLSKPAIVMFAYEGITVDPGFLKVVRPGTPFLVIPIPQPRKVIPQPAAPAPAVPAARAPGTE